MYAEVIIELKAKALDKTFIYKIPSALKPKIQPGCRVKVPFGKREVEGFVLRITEKTTSDYDIKEILSLIDEKPVFNHEMLKLGSYICERTLSTKIQAYQTMLPSALKARHNYQASKKYTSYLTLVKPYQEAMNLSLSKQGKMILSYFSERSEIPAREMLAISSSAVHTLLKKGILSKTQKEVYRFQLEEKEGAPKIELTQEQKKVYDTIMQASGFAPFLLHGVTGSGKTEVYLSLIETTIRGGKEALILVPEISLTPQLIQKFTGRFGKQIAVLHSKLSDGERYDEWRKIENKEVSIVIGTRSAIFAPFTSIGIIILDEEHSASYKQENNPKYHAGDIALWRGKYHQARVVFGSATPSIQSYTRASVGIYQLLEMKNRISTTLPSVSLVQMQDEIKSGYSLFSRPLLHKIKDRLQKGEQVLILLNKRGYTRVTACHSCGYVDTCPHCDIPLTYHKASQTMRCHYCGYGKSVMRMCPVCKGTYIDSYGLGTQKVEEELHKIYPEARILRMDADTTTSKDAYAKIVHDFKNKHYDILVGTQMIAKGHDFDLVTLVGVLHADATLHIPDFRSGERTFELLNQVAGRAGRREKIGEVIFQGFNMDHYSVRCASTHDYTSFYKEEMRLRKLLKYPPYYDLAVIQIRSKDEGMAQRESQKIRIFLDKKDMTSILLGPTACLTFKKNDFYSFQIILKYKKRESVISNLHFILQKYQQNKKVSVDIDFNPNVM